MHRSRAEVSDNAPSATDSIFCSRVKREMERERKGQQKRNAEARGKAAAAERGEYRKRIIGNRRGYAVANKAAAADVYVYVCDAAAAVAANANSQLKNPVVARVMLASGSHEISIADYCLASAVYQQSGPFSLQLFPRASERTMRDSRGKRASKLKASDSAISPANLSASAAAVAAAGLFVRFSIINCACVCATARL